MSSTDYLRLGEHKIFKELCASLPKNITKTLNLLAVRDSVLFTWDFQNNYVMSLNVKAARSREGDNVIHQVSCMIFRWEAVFRRLCVCFYTGIDLADITSNFHVGLFTCLILQKYLEKSTTDVLETF